jgi:hypothetical protein
MKNMIKSIFVNKKWPFNPCIGCLKPTNFVCACEIKFNLMAKLEFEDQSRGQRLLGHA